METPTGELHRDGLLGKEGKITRHPKLSCRQKRNGMSQIWDWSKTTENVRERNTPKINSHGQCSQDMVKSISLQEALGIRWLNQSREPWVYGVGESMSLGFPVGFLGLREYGCIRVVVLYPTQDFSLGLKILIPVYVSSPDNGLVEGKSVRHSAYLFRLSEKTDPSHGVLVGIKIMDEYP